MLFWRAIQPARFNPTLQPTAMPALLKRLE
jgi:hypothetical protein